MELVLYGSFNCPYSYLASLRADRLVELGEVRAVDWRAVVHDPDVPAGGKPVSGELADMFDRELQEIRELLLPDEEFPARRPEAQPNTTLAVARYASTDRDQADRLRRALFTAFWAQGENIGEQGVLERLGCPAKTDGERARRWEAEWRGTDRPVVPMMLLADGKVSRGLGALARLAGMIRPDSAGSGS